MHKKYKDYKSDETIKIENERMKEFIKRVWSKMNKNEPLTEAEQLIFNNPVDVRVSMANNSLYLYELSEDWSSRVRMAVAKNIHTPVDLLYKLANDEDYSVRACVALNPNTPADLLIKLSEDKSWVVRLYVTENRNTPIHIVEKLTNDEEWVVRHSAEIFLSSRMSERRKKP